jgi:hypothetical protein
LNDVLSTSRDSDRLVATKLKSRLARLVTSRKRLSVAAWIIAVAAIACLGFGLGSGSHIAFIALACFGTLGLIVCECDRRVMRERRLMISALKLLIQLHDGRSPERTADEDKVLFDQRRFTRGVAGVCEAINEALPGLPKDMVVDVGSVVAFWSQHGFVEPYRHDEFWVVTQTGRGAAMALRNSPLLVVR